MVTRNEDCLGMPKNFAFVRHIKTILDNPGAILMRSGAYK